jgi:hypothetical protein
MRLRRVLFFLAALMFGASALAATELESIISRSGKAAEEERQSRGWQESDVPLPAAPLANNMLPFYVSAATSNRFFVDPASLSVGSDGIVRYTLLVLTPEGGRNVGFEGMRCETKEWRIYASGRLDGSWSKSRSNQWSRIQDAASNRHHAALFLDYFCPEGVIARDVDEILSALKRDAGLVGGSR